MLLILLIVAALWLAAVVIFLAACRMAALGDATHAQAAERNARAAAAIDSLLVHEGPSGWIVEQPPVQQPAWTAAARRRITAYGAR